VLGRLGRRAHWTVQASRLHIDLFATTNCSRI